jgi:hypothetical protein
MGNSRHSDAQKDNRNRNGNSDASRVAVYFQVFLISYKVEVADKACHDRKRDLYQLLNDQWIS